MRYRLLFRRRRKKKTTTKRLRRISSSSVPAQRGRPVVLRAPRKDLREPPRAADRFRVDRVVVDDGDLKVCHVVEEATRRRLTLTTCSLQGKRDWSAWDRFKHECAVLRSLRHPGVVRYVEDGEADGGAYLLTERVEGQSLQERMDAGERYTDVKLEQICTKGLEVLDYLHELNPPVYHCDLHPGAIYISDRGKLTLAGFGRARSRLDTDELEEGRDGYAPPEQWRGEVGPGTDLYAFGATLAAVAAGRDAALLPHRGPEIDLDACLKPSRFREALRGLLAESPDARIEAAARLRGR